jgi:hypothetical protein
VTVRIPEEIVASYRPIAEREDRSLSKAILVALKRDLAERGADAKPKAAVQEPEAGWINCSPRLSCIRG